MRQYQVLINQKLVFAAFVVIDSADNINPEGKGQAKLLGENVLELGPLTPSLANIQEIGISQRIELMRIQGESKAVVGRMNIKLHLLAEQIEQNEELLESATNDADHLLPEMDVIKNFVWRARVDVRSAVNLPFNHTTDDRLPSCYVEIGWTMYVHNDLNMAEAVRSTIITSNRFPIWNHQVLYYPPSSVHTFEGFLNIYLKDKYQTRPIQKIKVPINTLKPYHPVHMDFLLDTADLDNRSHMYISITLEDCPEYQLSDSMVNILLHNINFDPLPKSTNRASIMMTTEKLKPEKVSYKEVEMKSDSHLVNVLIAHKTDPYSIFMTNTMRIPIDKSIIQNQFGSIGNFIIPRSFLDKGLKFFILVRDANVISNHSMPNSIAGIIDIITDDLLKTSYYSKNHDIVRFKVIWFKEAMIYKSLCHTRCDTEFSVRPVEEIPEVKNKGKRPEELDYDKVKENMMKNAIDGI